MACSETEKANGWFESAPDGRSRARSDQREFARSPNTSFSTQGIDLVRHTPKVVPVIGVKGIHRTRGIDEQARVRFAVQTQTIRSPKARTLSGSGNHGIQAGSPGRDHPAEEVGRAFALVGP